MVQSCHEFWLLWLKIRIWFFNRKGRSSFSALCVLIYYTINRRSRSNPIKRISFRKGIKENRIQNASTIKKKKFSNPTQRGNFFIYFVSVWRHGRGVRRGTANPFSPVQIWVAPDQQKTRNLLFCSADITSPILP